LRGNTHIVLFFVVNRITLEDNDNGAVHYGDKKSTLIRTALGTLSIHGEFEDPLLASIVANRSVLILIKIKFQLECNAPFFVS
jgi:hypothetical protein